MELTQGIIDAVHAQDEAAALCQATTLSAHGNEIVKCGHRLAVHDLAWHAGADPITDENRMWEL